MFFPFFRISNFGAWGGFWTSASAISEGGGVTDFYDLQMWERGGPILGVLCGRHIPKEIRLGDVRDVC